MKFVLVASLVLCSANAFAQSPEHEPVAIIELGVWCVSFDLI
jgi:hypothetical protein